MGALVYAGLYLNEHRAYVSNPEWMNDDTRQHLLPFVAQQNPEAFQDGFLLQYTRSYLPPGYRWVMHGLSRNTHPLQASKHLGVFLMLTSMALALGTGFRLGGPAGAAMTLILMIRSAVFDAHAFSGLFRSFALPLVFLHLNLLLCKRHTLSAWSLVLQALFYPPMALVFLPVNGLLLLISCRWQPWIAWRKILPPAIGMAVCLLSIGLFARRPPDIGRPIAYRDAVQMREFLPGGRLRELPLTSTRDVWTDAMDITMLTHYHGDRVLPVLWDFPEAAHIPVFSGLLASILLLLIFTRHPAAGIWLATALSSTALLLIANRVAFRLGFPNRFVCYAIPIVSLILWAALWGATRNRPVLRGLTGLLGFALLTLYPWSLSRVYRKAFDARHGRKIYAALRETGPDTLVASWAGRDIPDEIPLQAGREVFVNYQNAHPIYFPYYEEVRGRILDCIRIAYATDPGEITRIRDERGLTHFVVRKSLYDLSVRAPGFFAPFEDLSARVRRQRNLDDIVLLRPDPSWIVAENDLYQLFDLRKMDAPPAAKPAPPEAPAAQLVFPGDLQWISLELDPLPLRPGSHLTMHFHWHGPAHMAFARWIVFVHFRHEGRIVFTGDHPVFKNMDFGALDWNLYHTMDFHYSHTIPVPDNLPPGEIEVHIGTIDPIDHKRILPLFPEAHNGRFDTGIRLQFSP